ncbi:subtilisin-like protein [Lactarius pseudohatsudake]|nr:subtilisin-like protein [Lactarius pseudohatsudake]
MRYQLFSAFFALAAVVLCFATLPTPRWDNMRVKHAWDAVPENWESLGIPSAGTAINLHSALKTRREKALVTALYEEQVVELVMPHPHTLELVKSWLEYHGVPSSTSLTHGGNWLTLTNVSVSKANDLLGASYQLYRHAETKEVIICTVSYSLPAALHGHVQTVAPTTFFASPRMSWQTPRKRSGGAAAGQVEATSGDLVTALLGRADYDVTPPFLRWLYNLVTYVPAATDRNVLGISGFVQEYPNPVDLTTFMDHFHGTKTGATYTVVQVNSGGYNPNNPGTEASVDVHSSYANYETELPLDHAKAVCDLFTQLGARGVCVLIASGDEGVGEGDCMTDGNVRFKPTFPANCPWVTGVGGTSGYPEAAAILSGGGFSDYFKRPDYLVARRRDHLLRDSWQPVSRPLQRGYPDIAAQAFDIGIIFRNEYKVMEGTSCSTPAGFLNPWLYGTPRAGLNGITSGSNPGCNTDGSSAVVGWDPVTGLGSPDFEHLQHLFTLGPRNRAYVL